MKKILLLLLVLFVSISAVCASENISQTDCTEISCEDVILYETVNETSSADIIENNSSSDINIQADDYKWYNKANPTYKFNITDFNNTGVANVTVNVKINNKVFNVTSDENGSCTIPLNLKSGKYDVQINYGTDTVTKNINLFSSRISHTNNIASTYGTKVKYSVRLLDNAGNPMSGVNITFKVNKKKYVRKTNSDGYAILWLNSNSGKYTIRYSVSSFSGKNTYTVKNKISFKILKWGLKGDVSKAPLIKKNMPKNKWVKKCVEATKKGLPFLTIKGGKGKVVFMTAGVHGNELNSQVAAMKMIKYLTEHPIKGTVYIVPFVNVKAISKKVRLTNYDFNRVAHVKGTVSNKLVNLIIKKKCDAYGDFHTTVSPGVPGINVVLGYTSPSKCVPMTKYISKNAKVSKIFYYPGQKYRWSLADWVNLKGTSAVICEVISPVNVVSAKATSLSYKEMTCFLNYNKII